jgi:hypothetical protein
VWGAKLSDVRHPPCWGLDMGADNTNLENFIFWKLHAKEETKTVELFCIRSAQVS